MMWRHALLSLLAVFIGLGALAQQTAPEPAEVEARTEAIAKTLRCVVCQNQSINDSSAPLAQDMKALVERRVLAGDSDTQVRAYMQERYGDFVLMRPPVAARTSVLWFGPLALLLVLLGWFVLRARKPGGQVEAQAFTDEERALIDTALGKQEEGEQ